MKLYDKIQKLLNMANGSVQGNEAEVALKMAHDLMEANNITMEELDAAGRDKELGKLTQEMYQEKAFKIWEKTLMRAIAKLFDCEIVYSKTPGDRKMQQKVIGREGNVKTTTMMYEWIREKAWKDAKQKFGGSSISACNSYCAGVANTIWNRVCEMKGSESSSSGWGLVAVNEVKQYVRELYPLLINKKNHSTISDRNAYGNGVIDGKSIGLNKQFGLRAIGAR